MERRYRIVPWPIRIGVPLAALIVVAGLLNAGAAAAIPVPIILAAGWVYSAERCGLVATEGGIESRMTRPKNRFQHPWTDIESFELVDNGAQVALAVRLGDGSRQLLPSTRAWFWDKSKVKHILADLIREQSAHKADLTPQPGPLFASGYSRAAGSRSK
jgi:hypothetical protein